MNLIKITSRATNNLGNKKLEHIKEKVDYYTQLHRNHVNSFTTSAPSTSIVITTTVNVKAANSDF